MFPQPDMFLGMVQRNYALVYRHKSFEFAAENYFQHAELSTVDAGECELGTARSDSLENLGAWHVEKTCR